MNLIPPELNSYEFNSPELNSYESKSRFEFNSRDTCPALFRQELQEFKELKEFKEFK